MLAEALVPTEEALGRRVQAPNQEHANFASSLYDRPMPIWALVTLAIFVVLATVTTLYAITATVKLFLRLSQLGKALVPVTNELAAASERLGERAEATALGVARLERSVAELRASREQLATLHWALGDVLRAIRVARSLVPRK
jgi:hypothetical protein